MNKLQTMIIIRTLTKVTHTDSSNFYDSQELNGLLKLAPTSREDCHWECRISKFSLGERFEAIVEWYQLQEYDTGNPEDTEGVNPVLIYKENFILNSEEIQGIWENLEGQILSTDNYLEKIREFTEAGTLMWIADIRNIFNLSKEQWEKL